MKENYLIYGAYGYSGELIARRAKEKGHRPILAGRDPESLERLGSELDLETRVFKLEDPQIIEEELRPFKAVLHCAGPFLHTHGAVVRACLETGTHYLDITGEAAVFEAVAARHKAAQEAGIFLLPGVGFDVVPTDCLALHLKERLADATELRLGIKALSRLSRGTALTMAENLHRGGLVRRGGRLTPVPAAYRSRSLDFGDGKTTPAVTIPWGDVATAFHTTGIPNIEVYAATSSKQKLFLKWTRWLGPLLATTPMQTIVKGRIRARTKGPNETQRSRGRSYLWGEATNDAGRRVVSRLQTPDGYTLTAQTAVAIMGRVLEEEVPPGFLTPAKAFGSDFITTLQGVSEFLDEEG